MLLPILLLFFLCRVLSYVNFHCTCFLIFVTKKSINKNKRPNIIANIILYNNDSPVDISVIQFVFFSIQPNKIGEINEIKDTYINIFLVAVFITSTFHIFIPILKVNKYLQKHALLFDHLLKYFNIYYI